MLPLKHQAIISKSAAYPHAVNQSFQPLNNSYKYSELLPTSVLPESKVYLNCDEMAGLSATVEISQISQYVKDLSEAPISLPNEAYIFSANYSFSNDELISLDMRVLKNHRPYH